MKTKKTEPCSTRENSRRTHRNFHSELNTDDIKNGDDLTVIELIKKINPRAYNFLPESLMLKLEYIIQKYEFIVQEKDSQTKIEDLDHHEFRPKPSSEIEKDLMIS
jgi:hypothetical protein